MLNFASGDQLIWLVFMPVMRMRNPLAFEFLRNPDGGPEGGMRNGPTLAPHMSGEGWPGKYQQALTQPVSQLQPPVPAVCMFSARPSPIKNK